MKLSKTLIAAAVAVASLSANATLTVSESNMSGSFLTLAAAGPNAGTLGPGVGTIVGGSVLNADSPTADIQAFGAPYGGTFLAAGPAATSPAVLTLTSPTASFISFLWGSPDTYNTLTVTTSANTYTFVPGGVGGLTFTTVTGNQSYAQYVGFTTSGGETLKSLTFASSQNAFEAANFSVTPVPEPETYALMLAGLGVLGFVARRRKAA